MRISSVINVADSGKPLMIVDADTGPVNCLVLSGQVDLAHDLYGTSLTSPRRF